MKQRCEIRSRAIPDADVLFGGEWRLRRRRGQGGKRPSWTLLATVATRTTAGDGVVDDDKHVQDEKDVGGGGKGANRVGRPTSESCSVSYQNAKNKTHFLPPEYVSGVPRSERLGDELFFSKGPSLPILR